MPAHRWDIFDPDTNTTVTFPINPSSGGIPPVRNSFTKHKTTAGVGIVFQGNGELDSMEWEGALLSEDHVDFWYDLAENTRPVRLTDDLGKQVWILIETFEPKREWKASNQFFVKFTATAVIVDRGTW